MSTATLSAPAKTRTARKTATLADLIVETAAIADKSPEIAPIAESSPEIRNEAETAQICPQSQPILVFMVAAIAIFALAQTATAITLILAKVTKFIAKKALAFAKSQMGSKPKPDYSPIFSLGL